MTAVLLMVLGCEPPKCPEPVVCENCDEKVRVALEMQAVSIEDGPWLIKTTQGSTIGRAYAVAGELGLEVFDSETANTAFAFLSESNSWEVSIASGTPSCSTADKCTSARASFDQADVDAEIENPCLGGKCVGITPATYHAAGVYKVDAFVDNATTSKVAYYEVSAPSDGVWTERIHTERGRPFPWPNDVEDDASPGKKVTWKVTWHSQNVTDVPTSHKRWREYTVKPG
jgi:hypothetical protein